MELPSGRRLESEPPPRARRRCRPRRCADGDGTDRISALPEELLLDVLVRLHCVRAAARVSLLSRRWRGLWRHLPELSFREISADALDDALAQVASPALSLLEIDIPEKHRVLNPARVSSLLQTAAGMAPAEFVFSLWGHCKDRAIPIEIPCFGRATSIKLAVWNLFLTPPPPGIVFPVLESLSITGCCFDTDALILRCPRLRVLQVCNCSGISTIMIHSPTIEELVMDGNGWAERIDIKAPVLKQLKLSTYMGRNFSVSFLAPMIEEISWYCLCDFRNVGIGELWLLRSLHLWTNESVYTLRLSIDAADHLLGAERNLMQEIAQFPNFSVLELYLATWGHVFGGMVFNLLGACTAIKRLKVVIEQLEGTEACPPNCPCDQPQNWRSQSISLTALEEVEIEGFRGAGHEVDFLKLLFRSATLMKRMIVRLSPKILPGNRGCKKIFNIIKGNPSVECSVYRSCG